MSEAPPSPTAQQTGADQRSADQRSADQRSADQRSQQAADAYLQREDARMSSVHALNLGWMTELSVLEAHREARGLRQVLREIGATIEPDLTLRRVSNDPSELSGGAAVSVGGARIVVEDRWILHEYSDPQLVGAARTALGAREPTERLDSWRTPLNAISLSGALRSAELGRRRPQSPPSPMIRSAPRIQPTRAHLSNWRGGPHGGWLEPVGHALAAGLGSAALYLASLVVWRAGQQSGPAETALSQAAAQTAQGALTGAAPLILCVVSGATLGVLLAAGIGERERLLKLAHEIQRHWPLDKTGQFADATPAREAYTTGNPGNETGSETGNQELG